MMGLLITFSAFGLLLILLGYLIKDRKKYNLIAGYNTMSEAEQAKVDIAGLAGFMKQVLVAMGLFIMAIALLDYFIVNPQIFAPELSGIIILAGTIYLLIKARKFNHN